MFKVTVQTIGAIVAGLIVAFLLVVAVEFFGDAVHPPPPDFGGTMEEMCRHVERFPHWVLAVVVPLWGFTAFLATWIALRIGNRCSSLLVGSLLLAAAGFNTWMLPYPLWFKIAILIAIPSAIALSHRSRRSAPRDAPQQTTSLSPSRENDTA
jgi:hypothetical protein